MPISDGYRNWFIRNGQEPPEEIEHDIRDKVVSINPRNWRMEGNKLMADTDMGPFAQFMPTDVILKGTDEEGLPIFKKIV